MHKFGMNSVKPVLFPWVHLPKAIRMNKYVIWRKRYRGMIDSLVYLTVTRVDIMFILCLSARNQSSQRVLLKSH